MWKLLAIVVALGVGLCFLGSAAGGAWWWFNRGVQVAPGTDGAATPVVPPEPPSSGVSSVNHVDLGMAAYAEGRLEDALREFDAAVDQNPRDGVALSWRGRTYAEQKMYDRALPDLEDAAKLLPGDFETWRALGFVRVHSEDDSGAVDAFTHALALSPKETHLLVDRANAKFHAGDRAGSLVDATAACDAGVEDGCVLRDRISSVHGR